MVWCPAVDKAVEERAIRHLLIAIALSSSHVLVSTSSVFNLNKRSQGSSVSDRM